jgi:hypothetical protein
VIHILDHGFDCSGDIVTELIRRYGASGALDYVLNFEFQAQRYTVRRKRARSDADLLSKLASMMVQYLGVDEFSPEATHDPKAPF